MAPAEASLKSSMEELKKLGIKKGSIEVSNFQVKPVYKAIRDHTKFYGFFVTYEVTVQVEKAELIGKVADALVSSSVHEILSIEWVPLEQEEEEGEPQGFVRQAIEITNHLCQSFGEEFAEVQSIEPVEAKEEAGEEEEEEEEEADPEEEEAPPRYKVVLDCRKRKK
jgi:uncharacterized protein YggE